MGTGLCFLEKRLFGLFILCVLHGITNQHTLHKEAIERSNLKSILKAIEKENEIDKGEYTDVKEEQRERGIKSPTDYARGTMSDIREPGPPNDVVKNKRNDVQEEEKMSSRYLKMKRKERREKGGNVKIHGRVLQKAQRRERVMVNRDDIVPDGSIIFGNDAPLQVLAAAIRGKISSYLDTHLRSPPEIRPPRSKTSKRNFRSHATNLWTNGVIPYMVEIATFPDQATAQALIDDAVSKLETETCLDMKLITKDEITANMNYVVLLGNETGCWSWVGNAKFGTKYGMGQKVSLGPGCVKIGTVLHELMHAIGMEHEQSRLDRDKAIKVLFNNINEDNQYNYDREITDVGVPYDLSSLLQYAPYGFAKAGTNAMASKDSNLEFLMYLNQDLSFYDVKDISEKYQCAAKCDASTLNSCQNGGFINHNCECKCPEGLTGSNCTDVQSTGCGGTITLTNGQTRVIMSPNYPNAYNSGTECVWLIMGESNSRIMITLDEIDLPFDASFKCQHYVEVKYNEIGQRGPRECGAVYSPSPVSFMTSQQNILMNKLLVRFDGTSSSAAAGKGFSATVKAFHSGCSSSPCQAGSTCQEGASPGEYICRCYPGMSGQFCNLVDAKSHVGCDFESDTKTGCFLKDDPTADMLWGVTTRSSYTEEGVKKYQHAKKGSVFANFELYLPVHYFYDKTRFISFLTFEPAERCLMFSYYMENKKVTYPSVLKVEYSDSTGTKTELFSRETHTGNSWIEKHFDIPSVTGLQIRIEGAYGQNKLGLDEVHLFAGKCDHPCSQGNPCSNGGSCIAGTGASFTCTCPKEFEGTLCENLKNTAEFACDFEVDMTSVNYDCFLTNAANDVFDWKTHTGETSSANTGPIRSYNGVKYIYIEASSPRQTGDKARLVSNLAFRESWYCMRLQYNMRGTASMGTLSVGTTEGNGNDHIAWYKQGNQGSTWHSGSVNLQMMPGKQIFVDGIRGASWSSDIAIDAVTLTSGTCGEIKCDFEVNVNCGLVDCTDCNDDFDWSRNSGKTTSSWTGPSSAKTGQYYVYTEMSGRPVNASAKLISNVVFASAPYCMSFSYHMYGGNKVGTLEIIVNDTVTGKEDVLWTLTGNQGDQWHEGLVSLGIMHPQKQLFIVATRKDSWQSDIAVDDIIVSTTCPTFECTFETTDLGCLLFESTVDDFDWTIGTGQTDTEGTGPVQAVSGQGYKYIESSTPRVAGNVAMMYSNYLSIKAGGTSCLSFWYILNGSDVGSLEVITEEKNGTKSRLFFESAEVPMWSKAQYNTQFNDVFKLMIKGTVGDGDKGDIAIDNVKLDNSRCQPVFKCSFEVDEECILENVKTDEDEFDWTRREGGTPSHNTGPSSAAVGDFYAYIETSSPRVNGDKSILRTSTINTFGYFCLTFSYHMYGSAIKTLSVLTTESGKSPATIWSKTGNQGNQWMSTSVQFSTMDDFQLSVIGERGTGWSGDIAVDNIFLFQGKCGILN